MTNIHDERLRELVGSYLDTKEIVAKHTDELKALEASILEATGDDLGKIELAPGVGITITKPRSTFNAARAADVLTPEQQAACTEAKISGAMAKKVLPPAVYALCTTSNGQRGLRAL